MKKPITLSHGRIEVTATSKTEAKAELANRIDWYLAQPEPWIESRFGFVLIVAAMPNGDYASQVIAPTYVGKRQFFSCFGRYAHIDDAIERLRLHAAQNAWRSDVDDREICVQSGLADVTELKRWIAFQRKYIEFKANGLSDGDAHREACLAAAAAPELLAALKHLKALFDCMGGPLDGSIAFKCADVSPLYVAARAAIAKAEGTAP